MARNHSPAVDWLVYLAVRLIGVFTQALPMRWGVGLACALAAGGPGVELVRGLVASGQPVLVVTGHYGNWELGAYLLGLWGAPGHVVARPLDNPHLDRHMTRFR